MWVRDLTRYREFLRGAWSIETLHESFRNALRPGEPASYGQCGVSSAWLVETLVSRQVRNLTYCYGHVFSTLEPQRIELERHCWIEVSYGADRLVVDLTGDQSEILRQHEVLYDWHDELQFKHHVDYRPHTRLTPLQLKYDLVQSRLAILRTNLGAKL
jgi:hypothetical protein